MITRIHVLVLPVFIAFSLGSIGSCVVSAPSPDSGPGDENGAADGSDNGSDDSSGAGGSDDGTDNPDGGGDSDGTSDGGGAVDSGDLSALQVFPADNPWNQDISEFPVHPNSDAYIASIGANSGLHPDFGTVWEGAPIGIPYNLVNADTPLVNVSFDYADESDAGPYPIPSNVLIEGVMGFGGLDSDDVDGDRHVLLVDPASKKLYELFYAFPNEDGTWRAGSGAIFDLTSNALRPAGWTSADAAGLPIFAGLVRYDEVVERGEITHAIRFTVSQTQRAYIPPATHYASSSTDENRPPMGLRVRLKPDFDIGGFSPNVQVILRAMKQYGMIVADNGSNWYVSGAPDSRWDDEELHQLGDVRGADFEAVYTGEAVPGND